jgi:uncharacterized membrane protein YhfC
MLSEKSVMKNIIIAMKISGVHQLAEGSVYWALFRQGVDADTATGAVKHAIDQRVLRRDGHVLILNNGKEDSSRTRAVCNS